jgi:hypothetical protein
MNTLTTRGSRNDASGTATSLSTRHSTEIGLPSSQNQCAADVACANYFFDQRKVKVIPYGSNLLNAPNAEDMTEGLLRRRSTECELLFVGVDR